jgi:uncharacterized protein YecA (UPF0149 family)
MEKKKILVASAHELENLILIEERERSRSLTDRVAEIARAAAAMDDMKYGHLSKKDRNANVVPVRTEPKVQRNDPCPCGSGKKYKKCCEP